MSGELGRVAVAERAELAEQLGAGGRDVWRPTLSLTTRVRQRGRHGRS